MILLSSNTLSSVRGDQPFLLIIVIQENEIFISPIAVFATHEAARVPPPPSPSNYNPL